MVLVPRSERARGSRLTHAILPVVAKVFLRLRLSWLKTRRHGEFEVTSVFFQVAAHDGAYRNIQNAGG
jgi:hypothetical protein